MRTTIHQSPGATPAHRANTPADNEPIIGINPGLGPIPPIPVTATTFPAVNLRRAAASLLAATRAGLAHRKMTNSYISN